MSESKQECPFCKRPPGGQHSQDCSRFLFRRCRAFLEGYRCEEHIRHEPPHTWTDTETHVTWEDGDEHVFKSGYN